MPTKQALTALVVGGALGITGCASSGWLDNGGKQEPRLEVLGGTEWSAGIGIPNVPRGGSWVIQGVAFCLDQPGSVRIDSVSVADSSITVTGFALRDHPLWKEGDGYGAGLETDVRGKLSDAGFDPSNQTVTAPCLEDSARSQELGLEVRSPKSGVGKFNGFDVAYTRDGERETIHVPLRIVLCPHKKSGPPNCTLPESK